MQQVIIDKARMNMTRCSHDACKFSKDCARYVPQASVGNEDRLTVYYVRTPKLKENGECSCILPHNAKEDLRRYEARI